jgi:hypothetical protein
LFASVGEHKNGQLTTLKRMYPKWATQLDSVPLTKGEASDAMNCRLLRKTLDNPPSPDAEENGAENDR